MVCHQSCHLILQRCFQIRSQLQLKPDADASSNVGCGGPSPCLLHQFLFLVLQSNFLLLSRWQHINKRFGDAQNFFSSHSLELNRAFRLDSNKVVEVFFHLLSCDRT